jgi:hypothetical protein
MAEAEPPLDPDIVAQAATRLRTNEVIHWWLTVPTGDLVVALIDRNLQQACAGLLVAADQRPFGWGRTLVFALEGGGWRQVSEGSWGVGVRAMLEYFRAAGRAQPGLNWERGQRFCLDWLEVQGRPWGSVTQADIDGLLARLDGEPEPGLAWAEVRRHFVGWARMRGFPVPDIVHANHSVGPPTQAAT